MKAQLAMNRENTARAHTGSARMCSVPMIRAKSERMKGSERALQSFSAAARKINRPGDERFIFLVFAFIEQSMRGHDDASTYSARVLPINSSSSSPSPSPSPSLSLSPSSSLRFSLLCRVRERRWRGRR